MCIQVNLKGREGRGRQKNEKFLVSNTDNSITTANKDEAEGNQSTQYKEKNSERINRWTERTTSINIYRYE